MKQMLKEILAKSPTLYRIIRKAYYLRSFRVRVVELCGNTLGNERLEQIDNNVSYNDIISDLVAYTGFQEEKLLPYLLRYPRLHFESEFNWVDPKDELELTWFYRTNVGYFWGNSMRPYVPKLDIITQGKILDYGAGIGCNTIGLAKRGVEVDYLEINRLQADFIKFRAERHKLNNVKEVKPYSAGKFDPVLCIVEQYDAIIAMDVLEHIPNYHVVVEHFIKRLKPSGLIIENSPFDPFAADIALHIRPSLPLEEVMIGMERIDEGIWKKKS